MQKITPCLWFDNQAEEAVNFYTSLFKNSRIGTTLRYDQASAEVSGRPEGSVLTIEFELEEQKFVALNGGPVFSFTPAISFMVDCDTQEEIDRYWNALSADPASEQCGWLKDKFGISWQIVPAKLMKMHASEDKEKAGRVMKAMLEMKKLDIAKLEQAYEGR